MALISPKGPLYRHRKGIFKKSLRYQPLTLTTLAALVPPELEPEFILHDEGTGDIPLDIEADIIGITVITGSSTRAYELATEFRKRGRTVVPLHDNWFAWRPVDYLHPYQREMLRNFGKQPNVLIKVPASLGKSEAGVL